MEQPPRSRIQWKGYHRIISSRFPPIDLFERVSPAEDWEVLAEIEGLTNQRLRQSYGDISLVPPTRRVSGPGASYTMAPFVHVSPDRPSRFSDGNEFGVFYAAQDFATAVLEIAYHRAKFFAATNDEPLKTEERVLKGSIDATLHDIRADKWKDAHHPNDYSTSQVLAKKLRNEEDSNGIIYNSVRKPGGQNFATFWPDVMDIPIQTKHIGYHWNGIYVDKYFDYETEAWIDLPNLLTL